ncbi:hypothetical protein [Hymenobacter lapidarius]|uniref:hypothetical protein n=1 Tax=Hymenobacter lapidarius TaxID=1908237 RepID=UPI000F7788E3|nr:hypothetical protein [Hymenobacter lapidarius]
MGSVGIDFRNRARQNGRVSCGHSLLIDGGGSRGGVKCMQISAESQRRGLGVSGRVPLRLEEQSTRAVADFVEARRRQQLSQRRIVEDEH